MKVCYKEKYATKIQIAISEAKRVNRIIDKIIFTKDEFKEFKEELKQDYYFVVDSTLYDNKGITFAGVKIEENV